MNDELIQRAERLAIDFGHRGNTDAADTIRDLLAAFENVRSANVDCMEWYRAAIARAEAAEARLRELASAEPDGYAVTEAAGFTACFYDYAEAYEHAQEAGGRPIRALIRRPEMPK